MSGFTRLIYAHSKKFESHRRILALYTVWYNDVRIDKTVKMTCAIAAGISQTLWSMDNIVVVMDAAVAGSQAARALQEGDVSWAAS